MGDILSCGEPDHQATQLFMILSMADRNIGKFSELLTTYRPKLETMIRNAEYAR